MIGLVPNKKRLLRRESNLREEDTIDGGVRNKEHTTQVRRSWCGWQGKKTSKRGKISLTVETSRPEGKKGVIKRCGRSTETLGEDLSWQEGRARDVELRGGEGKITPAQGERLRCLKNRYGGEDHKK